MTDFTIEKGIPLPPDSYRGGGRPWKRRWDTLEVGDSVLLPTEGIARQGVNWARRVGRQFSIQKRTCERGWRVWRRT